MSCWFYNDGTCTNPLSGGSLPVLDVRSGFVLPLPTAASFERLTVR